jgi:hypothetical protein
MKCCSKKLEKGGEEELLLGGVSCCLSPQQSQESQKRRILENFMRAGGHTGDSHACVLYAHKDQNHTRRHITHSTTLSFYILRRARERSHTHKIHSPLTQLELFVLLLDVDVHMHTPVGRPSSTPPVVA